MIPSNLKETGKDTIAGSRVGFESLTQTRLELIKQNLNDGKKISELRAQLQKQFDVYVYISIVLPLKHFLEESGWKPCWQ